MLHSTPDIDHVSVQAQHTYAFPNFLHPLSKILSLELTRFLPALQRRPVRLVGEHELGGTRPRLLYGIIDPRPLLVAPHAVRPPPVHAAHEDVAAEDVVPALLGEHEQQEAAIVPLQTELRQALQDAGDAEVVVRCACVSLLYWLVEGSGIGLWVLTREVEVPVLPVLSAMELSRLFRDQLHPIEAEHDLVGTLDAFDDLWICLHRCDLMLL